MRTRPGYCSHRTANLLPPSLSSPGVLLGADTALAQALSRNAGLQDTEGRVLVYITRLGPLGSPMDCGCLCVWFLPHCWLWGSAKRQRVGDLGKWGLGRVCEEVLSEKATQEVPFNICPASTQASHIVNRQMPHGGMVKGAPPAVAS